MPAPMQMQAPEPGVMPAPMPGPAMPAPAPAMAPVAGPTHQVKGTGVTHKNYEGATFTIHNTSTAQTKVQAPPQYVTGQAYEVEAGTQTVNIDQQQMVPGQTQQQVVEIPTVQEVVEVQEIPEMQVREMIQEVPQIQHA